MAGSVIVVGGGLAGLATGIFAQHNGYRTVILERNDEPGGVCTTWTREGFTFDGALHWLMGAAPGHPFHELYTQVGALDHAHLAPIEHLTTWSDERTGESLALTADLDRLVADVAALSPSDEAVVREVVDLARQLRGFRPDPDGRAFVGWLRSHDRQLLDLVRHRETLDAWATRSRHRLVREGLFGDTEVPVAFLAAMLAGLQEGSIARVVGGCGALTRGMAERFEALGGELRLGQEVASIVVERDQAVGVTLAGGEQLRADRVVSAAPGHTTIFRLLGGRYTTRQLRDMYTSWPVSSGPVLLSIGVDAGWPDAPPERRLLLSPPWPLAHRDVRQLTLRMRPEQGVVQVMFEHDFDYWTDLHHTPTAYEQAKRWVAGHLFERLERWLPGLRRHVMVWDVATPYTYWRYTRAWRGAYDGWRPRADLATVSIPRHIDGLDRFHMAGQWVEPGGGVPAVLASGRSVVRDLCRLDGQPFAELGQATRAAS